MTVFERTLRRILGSLRGPARSVNPRGAAIASLNQRPVVEIAPNDPFLAYLQETSGAVNIGNLQLDSTALVELQASRVTTAVGLLSQGELVGLLFLGQRLGDRPYSADERRLLGDLGAQAAPALRVAQLVRQQRAEAEARQRIDQELQVARVIQRTLLPKSLPEMPGWRANALYEPAREVGGDFYDFIDLSDGRVGFVAGDVADKGVPAALVMATTRGVMRATAERLIAPGEVLARVNDQLYSDMPSSMFATCLYLVLDPLTGKIEMANAGHNLPYLSGAEGVREIRATGMPLGLMPGMKYEEAEDEIGLDETLLLFSDGIIEAHNPQREMYGFPRLKEHFARESSDERVLDFLMSDLRSFTGPAWEQEDDVTMVVLRREAV